MTVPITNPAMERSSTKIPEKYPKKAKNVPKK
jgi:hypothetical protein